jgi:hypothetical protein
MVCGEELVGGGPTGFGDGAAGFAAGGDGDGLTAGGGVAGFEGS